MPLGKPRRSSSVNSTAVRTEPLGAENDSITFHTIAGATAKGLYLGGMLRVIQMITHTHIAQETASTAITTTDRCCSVASAVVSLTRIIHERYFW